LNRLYEKDFYLWLQEMAIALRARDTKNMDWEGLLEAIEDMGASEKRALRSYVKRLIEHILKLQYWDSKRKYNQSHWEKEVVNFREEIGDILKESPSLENYLTDNYQDWYKKSLKAMKKEFLIPDESFVSLSDILREDYFG
jgi:hypothetical protein